MAAIVDLRGKRFGRLRIPRDAEPESRNRRAYWPCVCECGAQVWVATNKLRLGRTVSCGCYRADPEVRKMALEVRYGRLLPLAQRGRGFRGPKVDPSRTQTMREMQMAAATLGQIGEAFRLTRQRVQRIPSGQFPDTRRPWRWTDTFGGQFRCAVRKWLRAEGCDVCYGCWGVVETADHSMAVTRCAACRRKRNAKNRREYNRRRRDAGLCIRCKRPSETWFCSDCRGPRGQ
jgi:hypothetical protein